MVEGNPGMNKPARLRFNRLFWRIFLAFWSTSLAILFIATFVIVDTFESSRFVERYEARLRERAVRIIERQNEGVALPETRNEDGGDPRSPQRPVRGLAIYDESGALLYGQSLGQGGRREIIRLHITDTQGRQYEVLARAPGVPLFMRQALTRLQSLQFILILVASTLASLFLSWHISRPLKQLGRFSRSYASGDTQARIDSRLLRRGDEVGDLAKDLASMTGQVERTLAAQERLLHSVSHELRAPLARLQAAAGLLEQKGGRSAQVDRMHAECERMSGLIQEILDYSRSRQIPVQMTRIDLRALLESLLESIRFEFPARQLNPQLPPGPVFIQGNDREILRAVENVLRNACHYTVEESPVDITLETTASAAVLCIRDHGPGVADAELQLLKQPFYRVGNQMHSKGFGLGLSIADKSIERHHGELRLANHSGGGLEVTFTLPLDR